MLAILCIWVACASPFLLVVGNMIGCLFFSAGWANGVGFGLSFQTVLSVEMTAHLMFILVTAIAGCHGDRRICFAPCSGFGGN